MSKTKTKTAKQKGARIDDTTFVRAWMTSSSAADAAQACGMAVTGVRVRAGRLRKAGVRLPKFRRGAAAIDIEGLNKLVQSYRKKQ